MNAGEPWLQTTNCGQGIIWGYFSEIIHGFLGPTELKLIRRTKLPEFAFFRSFGKKMEAAAAVQLKPKCDHGSTAKGMRYG